MADKMYVTTEAERRWRKENYQRNRERILKRQKQYDDNHKEQRSAYNKRYSMTHDRSEYFRERWKKKKEEQIGRAV